MSHLLGYLSLFKILPEPTVITDASLSIVYINPALEKLSGYKFSEVSFLASSF